MPSNRSNPDIRSSGPYPLLLALLIAVGASLYLLWFLSFPILAGYSGADGQSVTRLQFLSRILLPELWLSEISAGGRLPVGIVDRLPVLTGAVIWYAAGYFIGRPIVNRAVPNSQLTRLEHFVLAILAGLALLSTLTLAIGLARASSSRWPILLGTLSLLAFAYWANSIRPPAVQPFCRAPWLGEGSGPAGVFGQLAGRLVVALTVALGCIYVLGVLMPPYEFDVVEYHLQSAKEFYQQGFLGFNNHNIYVNMPLGLEMHSLAAMSLVNGEDGWWLGGLIGKTIIGGHALLAAGLIGGFCARHFGVWVGWCAAGMWLAVPGNAHVSFTGLIDTALGTYILAGLIVLTELWRNCAIIEGPTGLSRQEPLPESSGRETSRTSVPLVTAYKPALSINWSVFLAFIYAGEAAAIKYPGLIFAVFPAVLWVAVIRLRFNKQGFWKQEFWRPFIVWSGCAFLAGIATFVPWYVKNTVLTRNPVYPLAYSVFGGRDLDESRAKQWSDAHRVPVDDHSGSAYSMTAALQSAQQVLVKSEFAQPALPILLICGIAGYWHTSRRTLARQSNVTNVLQEGLGLEREKRWIPIWFAMSLWILAVWWFMTHRIDRFWLPAVALWCVLAGCGVAWIAHRVSHALATVLVLTGLIYGCIVNASPVLGDNRYLITLDALRNDSGDEENPGRISRAIGWCNRNLTSSQTKLLLVGEARAFDFRMPIIYSTCFDPSPAEKWLRGLSPDEQRQNLQANNVTHLLVNWSEIARYRSPGNYGFSDWPQKEDIQNLEKSGLFRSVASELDPAITEILEVIRSEKPDLN